MKIEHNFSLLPYNTFRIDAKARYFVNIESSSDFIELMQTAERLESENKLFIGGGSNMLLTEPIFEGMVIHNGILGKEISSDSPHEMFLKVGGGENRNDFVRRVIDRGLYGVENLVSIPGNVAAAPIQNIGAYGMELEPAVMAVGGIDLRTGTYETISHKECQFGYRDSIFKSERAGDFFITDVTFRLQHYEPDTYAPVSTYGNISATLEQRGTTKPSPHDIAEVITEIRAGKLPDINEVGTAGSFFKNVILSKDEYDDFLVKLHHLHPDLRAESYALEGDYYKIPTGRILDQVLGHRGDREGAVGCWENQALCLVNYGGATGADIVRFARKLQNECQEKLGIAIEPEVNFI